jgi:hypothetical protein
MVVHFQPAHVRWNGARPTAIPDVLVTTSPSRWRIADILLGTPTWSARTPQGRWALYHGGTEVVVVHPGGAIVGPGADVAAALAGLGGHRHDPLDRRAAAAIGRLLTTPSATRTSVETATRWAAIRPRSWSNPAAGYWLSGTSNQPATGGTRPSGWPGAQVRAARQPVTLPHDATPRSGPPNRTQGWPPSQRAA